MTTEATETETETAGAETVKVETKTQTATSSAKTDISAEELLDRTIGENAKYRQKNAEYKQRIKELETQAQKASELEEQVTKVEQRARERITQAELWAMLKADGVQDRDVLKLMDTAAVEYDEDGNPKNLEDIYAGFKETKSYLFEKKNVSNTSPAKAPEPNKSGSSAYDLSPEEFAKWMNNPSGYKP